MSPGVESTGRDASWGLDTPFWNHAANYSGGTPRFHTMDGPEEAVNAVVYASIHPQKELAVG